jgi:hypothetical protein
VHFIFHDKEYNLDSGITVEMDLKIATVHRDSIDVPIGNIQKGDEATAVSYAEAFKKMEAIPMEKALTLIKRFPAPSPIDEVYLKRKDVTKPQQKQQAAQQDKPISVQSVLITTAIVIAAILVFILLLPVFVYWYYRLRYGNAKSDAKAYWAYRSAGYYLHMSGIVRGDETPMQYARNVVDPQLGTSFTGFMNVYLKLKYAKQPLTPQEQEYVGRFLVPFIKQVKTRIPFKKRLAGFVNPSRMLAFFIKPDDDNRSA